MRKNQKNLPVATTEAATEARKQWTKDAETLGIAEELKQFSQIYDGNSFRVERVLKASLAGKSVTLGILGDSIPAGMGASLPENSLAERIADFWRSCFHPRKDTAPLIVRNASIGSNSLTNVVFRMDDDLLAAAPDLVIYTVWATHDPVTDLIAFESTVKRILDSGAALIVCTVCGGENVDNTEIFRKIAEAYGVPFLSWAAAFRQGGYAWTDFAADQIHPNDRGHGAIASVVNLYLTRTAERLAVGATSLAEQTQPSRPAATDGWRFLNATVYDRNDLTRFTLSDKGSFFAVDAPFSAYRTYLGWQSRAGGKPMVFEGDVTNGCMLLLKHGPAYGDCRFTVENAETGELLGSFSENCRAEFDYSWNTAFCAVSAACRVRITVTPADTVCVLGFMIC